MKEVVGRRGRVPSPYGTTRPEEGKEHPCGARAAALMPTGDVDSCNFSFPVQVYEKNGFTFWPLNTRTTGELPTLSQVWALRTGLWCPVESH